MTNKKTDPYAKGQVAYADRASITTNPYAGGTLKCVDSWAWAAGWHDALADEVRYLSEAHANENARHS